MATLSNKIDNTRAKLVHVQCMTCNSKIIMNDTDERMKRITLLHQQSNTER